MAKKKLLWNICLSSTAFIMLTSLAVSSAQDDKVSAELKAAIYQFRQENYDEALISFQRLKSTEPTSPLVEYYTGLTYKRMENYIEARKHLEASLSMTPKIKGALIELIDVLYRINELEEAKKWIKIAEDEGVRPAQAVFLKGLTQFKSGEYEQSISSFEDAKSLDQELSQSADYQIGMAHIKLKKYDQAKKAFNGVIGINPNSDIATYAQRYVEALDKKAQADQPLHILLRFGVEYDSNVVLKPADTAIVSNITDDEDTREVWDLRADYTWSTEDKKYNLKAGYAFHWANQNHIVRYNNLSNTFSLQPAVNFEKVQVTFPVAVTHFVLDEKNYLGSVMAGNQENFLLTPTQMLQTGIFYRYSDYYRPPYGDDARSGNELIGMAGWFYFFMENKGFFDVKYTINKNWADGNNWQYLGHRISTGVLVPFLKKCKAGMNAELFLQNFDNANSYYDKKRQDQVYSISPLLSYEFIKGTELQFQYTYINDQSNLTLYSYTRHVVTGAIQYRF